MVKFCAVYPQFEALCLGRLFAEHAKFLSSAAADSKLQNAGGGGSVMCFTMGADNVGRRRNNHKAEQNKKKGARPGMHSAKASQVICLQLYFSSQCWSLLQW